MGYRNYTGPKYDPSGDLAFAKGMQDFGKGIAAGITAHEKKKQEEIKRKAQEDQAIKNRITQRGSQVTKLAQDTNKSLEPLNAQFVDDAEVSIDQDSMMIMTSELHDLSLNMEEPGVDVSTYSDYSNKRNTLLTQVPIAKEIATTALSYGRKVQDAADLQGTEGGLVPDDQIDPETRKSYDPWVSGDKINIKRPSKGNWGAYADNYKGELKKDNKFEDKLIPEFSKTLDENKVVKANMDGIKTNFTGDAPKVSYIENEGGENSIYEYKKDLTGSGTITASVKREYLLSQMEPEIAKEINNLKERNPQQLVNFYNNVVKGSDGKITLDDINKKSVKNDIVNMYVDRYYKANIGELKAVAHQGLSHGQLLTKVANEKNNLQARKDLTNGAHSWLTDIYGSINYKPDIATAGIIDNDLESRLTNAMVGNMRIDSIKALGLPNAGTRKYQINLISVGGQSVDPDTLDVKPPKIDTIEIDFRNPTDLANFYMMTSKDSVKIKGADRNAVLGYLEDAFTASLIKQGEDANTAAGLATNQLPDMEITKKDTYIEPTGVGEAKIDVNKAEVTKKMNLNVDKANEEEAYNYNNGIQKKTVVDKLSKPESSPEAVKDIVKNDPVVANNPLKFASKYLGVSETDPKQQATIKGFLNNAVPGLIKGEADVTKDENAWCAAFVNDVLNQSGFESIDAGKDNYNYIRAKQYEKIGSPVASYKEAKPGDIIVMARKVNGKMQYHTGFYSGVKNGKPTMLGGNQKNRVSVRQILPDSITAVRRVKGVGDIKNADLLSIQNTEFFDELEANNTTR